MSGRSWRRWPFGTPPSTTSRWRRWMGVGAGSRGAARSRCPPWFGATWRRAAVLRYGENPHQQAALYRDDAAWPGLAQAEQLHGKEMSYNNFTDADAAWRAAFDHEEICVAIIKHANPCGIAISSVSVADAHRKAHECDPLTRVRRRDRRQHRRSASRWPRPSPTSSPRSSSRPPTSPARWKCLRARRISACSSPPSRSPAAPSSVRSAAACCCSSATRSTRRATTRSTGRWPPGRPPTRRPWPT